MKFWTEDLREYRALYFDKAKEYDALFQAYQATVTSSAWKMTKPLRASLDLAKKDFEVQSSDLSVLQGNQRNFAGRPDLYLETGEKKDLPRQKKSGLE